MTTSSATLRVWSFIHRWSSLISTAFLLMLCITGLPLIFHEELEPRIDLSPEVADGAAASLDHVVAQARAERPGTVVPYLYFDEDRPLVKVVTTRTFTDPPGDFHYQLFDLRTGNRIPMPQPNDGFLYVMQRLHVDMFAGMPGMLFLGGMALLLVLAIVSGAVLYAPFMRKLAFGTVRAGRGSRIRWLDRHNLLGIVTALWLSAVALTGAINTLAAPIEQAWQASQLVEMAAAQQTTPAADVRPASVDAAVATVRQALPDMAVLVLAMPGSPFSSDRHYAFFLTGNTPLTSRLLKPALVDADSGALADMRAMPWYVNTLFLSQPLHFGDYGGLPLKIIWALLDVAAIVILASGLYLWWPWRSRSYRGGTMQEVTAGDGKGDGE